MFRSLISHQVLNLRIVAKPLYQSSRAFSSSIITRQEEILLPSFDAVADAASSSSSDRIKNVITPSNSSSSNSSSSSISEIIHKYILHCNFTKNNTHLTLTAVTEDLNFIQKNPNLSFNEKVLYYYQLPEKVKLSLSTGQLGFRKSARGEYEATFQTSAKMFSLIEEKGYLDKPLEIVVKNFGKGRDSFIDALKGKEGDRIRPKVRRISDDTKLKFGGTRSPKTRRL